MSKLRKLGLVKNLTRIRVAQRKPLSARTGHQCRMEQKDPGRGGSLISGRLACWNAAYHVNPATVCELLGEVVSSTCTFWHYLGAERIRF